MTSVIFFRRKRNWAISRSQISPVLGVTALAPNSGGRPASISTKALAVDQERLSDILVVGTCNFLPYRRPRLVPSFRVLPMDTAGMERLWMPRCQRHLDQKSQACASDLSPGQHADIAAGRALFVARAARCLPSLRQRQRWRCRDHQSRRQAHYCKQSTSDPLQLQQTQLHTGRMLSNAALPHQGSKRVATCYDKLAGNSLVVIQLAAIVAYWND